MLTGIYACANSLEALEQQQNIIADNIANASTVGYKKNKGIFRSFEEALASNTSAESTAESGSTEPYLTTAIDLSAGSLKHTGAPLDVAIEGDALFMLQSPEGSRYTRRGNFTLSDTGKVVNSLGWSLMGSGGDIIVPPGAKSITIGPDGTVTADGQGLGQIMLVEMPRTDQLVRTEQCTFRTVDSNQFLGPAADVKTRQGYVETSNVQIIDELVSMIATLRVYEASQRMLSQQASTLERLTQASS